MQKNILIVDDETNILKVLSATLKREKYGAQTSRTAEEALAKISQEHFDLIVSDYKLPGMDGGGLLERIKKESPDLPVILLTAYGTIELAVEAMRKGAYTFLTKPVNLNAFLTLVRGALDNGKHPAPEGEETPGRYQFLNLIGKSKPMQEVFSMIQRVGKTEAGVLILGESGTGKELVARAIHYTSLRAEKPFIPIDCASIPSELLESELFGHEKGAFTCAYENKIGLIEMAKGGTVFFDEIGDLDFGLQKKLLRFLQEKEIHRLGSKGKIQVDVRILAATNRDIEDALAKGEFRSDLYYRLNVINIHLPPLRERKEDIPLLAQYFLRNFAKKNRKDIRGFEPQALEVLCGYEWPGNVRELENVIERAVILCPYEQIDLECLPKKFLAAGDDADEPRTLNLNEIEKNVVIKALDKSSWNQSKAAELLGITRKQLRTKMKNLGLMEKRNGG
jgi:two-component system response regulator AtoC